MAVYFWGEWFLVRPPSQRHACNEWMHSWRSNTGRLLDLTEYRQRNSVTGIQDAWIITVADWWRLSIKVDVYFETYLCGINRWIDVVQRLFETIFIGVHLAFNVSLVEGTEMMRWSNLSLTSAKVKRLRLSEMFFEIWQRLLMHKLGHLSWGAWLKMINTTYIICGIARERKQRQAEDHLWIE